MPLFLARVSAGWPTVIVRDSLELRQPDSLRIELSFTLIGVRLLSQSKRLPLASFLDDPTHVANELLLRDISERRPHPLEKRGPFGAHCVRIAQATDTFGHSYSVPNSRRIVLTRASNGGRSLIAVSYMIGKSTPKIVVDELAPHSGNVAPMNQWIPGPQIRR